MLGTADGGREDCSRSGEIVVVKKQGRSKTAEESSLTVRISLLLCLTVCSQNSACSRELETSTFPGQNLLQSIRRLHLFGYPDSLLAMV
jgi:hypothetical protein